MTFTTMSGTPLTSMAVAPLSRPVRPVFSEAYVIRKSGALPEARRPVIRWTPLAFLSGPCER
jgi:hypothetical protein